MLDFEVLYHSSIKFGGDIYVDPYKVADGKRKAKVIFITHSHYDHYSLDDVRALVGADTTIVATSDVVKDIEAKGIEANLISVEPDRELLVEDIGVKTFASYNLDKAFHPKDNNWVGYVLTIDNTTYMIPGDSDVTPELQSQKCDVLFVPIGGTYTMDAKQAATLTNSIKPKLVVPIHYNAIVGDKLDEQEFVLNLNKNQEYKIFL